MLTTKQTICNRIPNGAAIIKPRTTCKVRWDETADGRKFMTCGPKNLYLYDLIKARKIFHESGRLDRATFKRIFPVMSGHSPCNFTTIGGAFVKLGEARYEHGVYLKK